MVTEIQPASHRSCREREGGSAPVPAGCSPCPGQARRPGDPEGASAHSHTNVIPFAKRLPPGQPGWPHASRGQPRISLRPLHPPWKCWKRERLPHRARSPDRHQPTLRIWLELPSPAAPGFSCSPQRRRRHGGGDFGHLDPPLLRSPRGRSRGSRRSPPARRRSGAAPGPAARCRCHAPRETPGPAEPPRIPARGSRAPAKRSGSHRDGRPPRLRPQLSRLQVKPGASTPLRGSSTASPGTARRRPPAP